MQRRHNIGFYLTSGGFAGNFCNPTACLFEPFNIKGDKFSGEGITVAEGKKVRADAIELIVTLVKQDRKSYIGRIEVVGDIVGWG